MKTRITTLMVLLINPHLMAAQSSHCIECDQVAEAMLSMQERLCGMVVTDGSLAEVKGTQVYSYAASRLQEIPEENRSSFLRALKVGTSCVNESKWIKNIDVIYKDYLSRSIDISDAK